MEYPFGHPNHGHHHHRRENDEEFPPPGHRPPSSYDEPPPPPQVGHVFHTSHVGGPPPMEANYGRPHYPPPPMDDSYGRTNYPPPPMEENYGGSYNRPPPMSDYYEAPPPSQPQPPTSGYSSVQHVSHESESVDRHHDRHRFQPHVPSFFHHQTSDPELMDKPSFRVYTKADTNYSLTIRDGKVVLASNDPSDPFQVQLTPYNPDVLDASILWTESRDVGDGYRAIRMVNNINLNLDAWNADKEHGGVRDGTTVALWEWWKGDNRNQHWKIVRY
ncbi:ricin B-like lectin EULS3 isoform X2 [Solanum dulcamara]|uniref:ricin B-like lectin EULS3 isoform X2 n=1 Tax=Solanum dulcamara TaxID=45834 RepID=UPI002485924E|nr:ricin B-like lectin EULS3 isoform X2 [Solanum dulcamara]